MDPEDEPVSTVPKTLGRLSVILTRSSLLSLKHSNPAGMPISYSLRPYPQPHPKHARRVEYLNQLVIDR